MYYCKSSLSQAVSGITVHVMKQGKDIEDLGGIVQNFQQLVNLRFDVFKKTPESIIFLF